MKVTKYGRAFAVHLDDGTLLAVCLYKKGAQAIAGHVAQLDQEIASLKDEVDTLKHGGQLSLFRKTG